MRAFAFTGRRGRPRKAPTENLGAGTPEQAARRAELVGTDGDPVLSSWPVGILRARGFISDDQMRSAGTHAWARSLAIGKPVAARSTLDAMVSTGGSEAPGWLRSLGMADDEAVERVREALTADYNAVVAKLHRSSATVATVVHDVVVMEQTPWWVTAPPGDTSRAMRHATALMTGLRILEREWPRRVQRLPGLFG